MEYGDMDTHVNLGYFMLTFFVVVLFPLKIFVNFFGFGHFNISFG